MDKGHDAEQFAEYMEHYKVNGNDINSWSYTELVVMVNDYLKLSAEGNLPTYP